MQFAMYTKFTRPPLGMDGYENWALNVYLFTKCFVNFIILEADIKDNPIQKKVSFMDRWV